MTDVHKCVAGSACDKALPSGAHARMLERPAQSQEHKRIRNEAAHPGRHSIARAGLVVVPRTQPGE
jgi:hypothetical protein